MNDDWGSMGMFFYILIFVYWMITYIRLREPRQRQRPPTQHRGKAVIPERCLGHFFGLLNDYLVEWDGDDKLPPSHYMQHNSYVSQAMHFFLVLFAYWTTMYNDDEKPDSELPPSTSTAFWLNIPVWSAPAVASSCLKGGSWVLNIGRLRGKKDDGDFIFYSCYVIFYLLTIYFFR